MAKRIRYILEETTGIYKSTKVIPTAAGEVFVQYNKDNKVVQILSAVGDRTLDTFVYKNEHQMKIDVKKRLVALGASFDRETRIRD